MSTSAIRIEFDDNMMWLALSDGRQLGVPLAYFPRLLAARPEQRLRYELSGGGTGIHWDELDEDITITHYGDSALNLGTRITAWRAEDIRAFIEQAGEQ